MANKPTSSPAPVVLITGAADGIGRGLAEAYARSGARLILGDINIEKLESLASKLRGEGHELAATQCDITIAADNDCLVSNGVSTFGRIDIAICNAGISQIKPLLDLSYDDWSRMLKVNVIGTFLTLQAAANQMQKQVPSSAGRPKGKIINIASIAGRNGAGPIASVIAHYRASKAAVISLTHSAAYTLAPHITVNAICPGIVGTDMWREMDRDWTKLTGEQIGSAFKGRVDAIPMGRAQTPEDVANLAMFLSSDRSDYITGQALHSDGGLMMT